MAGVCPWFVFTACTTRVKRVGEQDSRLEADTLPRSHPDTLVKRLFPATDWFPFSNGPLLSLPLNSWLWKSPGPLIAVTLWNANRKRTLWGQPRKGRSKYPGGTTSLPLSSCFHSAWYLPCVALGTHGRWSLRELTLTVDVRAANRSTDSTVLLSVLQVRG